MTSHPPGRGQDTEVLAHQVPRPLMRNFPRGDSPEVTQNLCCNFVDKRRPVGTALMVRKPRYSLPVGPAWLCAYSSGSSHFLHLTRAFTLRFTPGCRTHLVRHTPVSSFGVNEKGPPQVRLSGFSFDFQTFPQINFHP